MHQVVFKAFPEGRLRVLPQKSTQGHGAMAWQ